MNKPIFEYYPQLESRIPCLNFAELPTPVQELKALGPSSSMPSNIWIKRDDLSHLEYGGNKVRKLEFILAEALEKKKKKILTFGAIGTNHGVATSLYGKKYGLDCEIILFDQALSPVVLNNLRLMQSLGANLRYRKSLLKTALQFYLQSVLDGEDTYPLFAGGSNVAGCLGFINAALELKVQVDYRLCPEPDYLYCPVGSSATVAGLTLGCALAGLKTQVIGVRVAPSHLGPIPICTQKTAERLMYETYEYLKQRTLAACLSSLPKVKLNNHYYGKGYGLSTQASNSAIELFASHDITLESTYTAKAAAALLSHSRQQPNKQFLYWHTFNSGDTSALIKPNIDQQFPIAIQELIARQSKQ